MLPAPDTGVLRTARDVVLAGVCLLLGCIAHVWAAGELPGPGSMLIAFALLVVACMGLTGGRRGFGFITLVLGLVQVLLHFGFGFSAAVAALGRGPVSNGSGSVPGAALAGHHMGSAPPGSAGGLLAALHATLHTWTAEMAIGHALATLATAACMAYAERVLWWLARLVLPYLTLPRPRRVDLPVRLGLGTSAWALLPGRHGVLLAQTRARRGPPAPARLAAA